VERYCRGLDGRVPAQNQSLYDLPMQELQVTAFRNDRGRIRVDLGSDHDFEDAGLRKWRTAVANHFEGATVTFRTGNFSETHAGRPESDEPDQLKTEEWTTADDFYTPIGLGELIERENENARELLVAQLRSPMGVVPFVGAGLSVDFGFPGWPKFLKDAAEFHDDPGAVLKLVQENKLLEAADLLSKSKDRFQLMVEKAFGRKVSEEQARSGAMSYLPKLATGPVITTNFDRVLEAAFQASGAPFEDFITGKEPDNVIRAMHQNKHLLIKLHGDALDRTARVFTGLEYDDKYENTIQWLAWIMFTNRPLLFLGASLDKDRTLELLGKIHKDLHGLRHYGVLAASYSLTGLRKRREELDSYGISPLWYLPGDFKSIERILAELIQEASTRLIWKPKKGGGQAPAKSATTPERASGPAPSIAASTVGQAPKKYRLLARRLARRIVNGRLAFFIGAGAHCNPELSARAYYKRLAEEHAIEESELQRAEAAQFIVDSEGRVDAWISAKEGLVTDQNQASVVHRFLAELPTLLREHGKSDASVLWILTTNYDLMLETVFENAREPFHLLYYQVDGKDAGRFLHREPDGTIRVIERPQNVGAFRDGVHIIVKLDGGIPYDSHFSETVAIAPIDFSISAGRLPAALPEAIRRVLRERSVLILGSSLKDPHVQNLVRWSAGTTRVIKTWAAGLGWSATEQRFWSVAGVELVDCDFNIFIPALREEVLRFLNPAVAAAAADSSV
jgi:hypothetical protein